MPCPVKRKKLNNFLKNVKLDEKKAVPDYNKGIGLALSTGRKDIANKLRKIRNDEKRHGSILKKIRVK